MAGRNGGSTVIVIDDHPLCAAAVSAALAKRPEYETRSCGSLRELGAILPDAGNVVLVLLDLMLPDATGMSGVKAVRALLPDAPICVISSRTDTATVRQAIAQDIVGFLPKTLAFDQMTDALGAGSGRRSSVPPPVENPDGRQRTAQSGRAAHHAGAEPGPAQQADRL